MRGANRSSLRWDQQILDRTQRILQAWAAPAAETGQPEAPALRQAIADADWDTVERNGDLDAVMEKIPQAGKETVVSPMVGLIDNFHLWGQAGDQRKVKIERQIQYSHNLFIKSD